MQERKQSQEIYQSSCSLIPGGVNSPVRSFPDLSLTPLIACEGQGDTLWDVDGHAYIDYCCSWGALILGHAPPRVVQAAIDQMKRGSSFGIATESERAFAAKLQQHVPSLEKMRCVSSGTEAAMSAIRLSRGFTSRPIVVKFNGNYHGHTDSLLIRAGSGVTDLNPQASSLGVPQEMVKYTVSLPYNDVATVRSFLRTNDQIAAVIVEPIAGNMGVVPGTEEFIHMLREETQKKGIVLIFDEVITGFRVGLKSAQGFFGITPDLSCFGKIVAGGFPAAVFGGRKEIMDCLAPLGGVYQAGTLSGNPVAMQAGLQTLAEIEEDGFYDALHQKMDLFLRPIEEEIAKKRLKACVQRLGSMFTLFFGTHQVSHQEDLKHLDKSRFKQLFTHLFERGIYIPPSPYEAWFISSAHTEKNLIKTRDLILHFLRDIS